MPLPVFLGFGAAAAAATKLVKTQVEKAKEVSALIEEAEKRYAAEARTYHFRNVATPLQQKLINVLLNCAFSESDKSATPPLTSDWKHLSMNINSRFSPDLSTQVCAARKHSLLSWSEYSFFTNKAIYYHHKKKGIHEFLFYDGINDYDASTGVVDYGVDHQKRNISSWEHFEKLFVEQISNILKTDDEMDTSVLEFCFNSCHDFRMKLSFFKTNEINNAFKTQCQSQNAPKVLQEYYDHIQIKSMKNGELELQFWAYFPQAESVTYNEDDSEDDIREKELLQQQLEEEAEERELKVHHAYQTLLNHESEIAMLFQQALYSLYGVLFSVANITFLDEPDFTYEGPSAIDRLSNAANTAQAFIDDYAYKHNLHK